MNMNQNANLPQSKHVVVNLTQQNNNQINQQMYPYKLLVVRRQANLELVQQGLATKSNNYISTFKQVKNDGKKAFFKGYLPYLLNQYLYALIYYLPERKRENVNIQILIDIFSASIVYPFQLVSNLLACQPGSSGGQIKSMMKTIQEIKDKQNKLNFYKGFSLFLIGYLTQSAFMNYLQFSDYTEQMPLWLYPLILFKHPIETLRLRLILSKNTDMSLKNITNYVLQTSKKESPISFFAGCIPQYAFYAICGIIRQSEITDMKHNN
ncbi:hypothetical protein ABPG74_019345 [Tetrahymena malaccensis]